MGDERESLDPNDGLARYYGLRATKAALNRYTEGLAHEVAEHGIFINAMAPRGIVLTAGAKYVRDIARRNPPMFYFDFSNYFLMLRLAWGEKAPKARYYYLAVLLVAVPIVSTFHAICFALDALLFPDFKDVEVKTPVFMVGAAQQWHHFHPPFADQGRRAIQLLPVVRAVLPFSAPEEGDPLDRGLRRKTLE